MARLGGEPGAIGPRFVPADPHNRLRRWAEHVLAPAGRLGAARGAPEFVEHRLKGVVVQRQPGAPAIDVGFGQAGERGLGFEDGRIAQHELTEEAIVPLAGLVGELAAHPPKGIRRVPPALVVVAAGGHEAGPFGVGQREAGDAEIGDFDRMTGDVPGVRPTPAGGAVDPREGLVVADRIRPARDVG